MYIILYIIIIIISIILLLFVYYSTQTNYKLCIYTPSKKLNYIINESRSSCFVISIQNIID